MSEQLPELASELAAELSTTHLVLIPSYNPGAVVYSTVAAARAHWNPVWVVVDGSDDGTAARAASAGRRRSGPARDCVGAQSRQRRCRDARYRTRARNQFTRTH